MNDFHPSSPAEAVTHRQADPAQDLMIEAEDAWAAVTSPVRLEMVQLFESEGEVTVAELAAAMGRPADGLYHHIHIMEDAGVVRQVGTQATAGGRRSEAVYALSGKNMYFSTEPEHDERRIKALRAILNRAMRHIERAMRSGIVRLRGPDQNLVFRSETALLRPEEVRQVRDLYAEIESIFHGARGRKGPGMRTNLAFALTPIAPQERGRRRAGEPSRATMTEADSADRTSDAGSQTN